MAGMVEVLDDGRGLRVGRLLVTTAGRQVSSSPILDGGTTRLDVTSPDPTRYGSLVIRYRRSPPNALVIGWRDAQAPWPTRWWPPTRAVARLRNRRQVGPMVTGGTGRDPQDG